MGVQQPAHGIVYRAYIQVVLTEFINSSEKPHKIRSPSPPLPPPTFRPVYEWSSLGDRGQQGAGHGEAVHVVRAAGSSPMAAAAPSAHGMRGAQAAAAPLPPGRGRGLGWVMFGWIGLGWGSGWVAAARVWLGFFFSLTLLGPQSRFGDN